MGRVTVTARLAPPLLAPGAVVAPSPAGRAALAGEAAPFLRLTFATAAAAAPAATAGSYATLAADPGTPLDPGVSAAPPPPERTEPS